MAAVPVSLDALASGDFTKLGPSHLLPLVTLYGRRCVVSRFGILSALLPFLVFVRSSLLACLPADAAAAAAWERSLRGVIWFCFSNS